MRWGGIQTVGSVKSIRRENSPDSRNGLLDPNSELTTRPGMAKLNVYPLGSLIRDISYFQSDDGVHGYDIALTDDGRAIEDPENYTYIPQPANLGGHWKFEEASGLITDGSGQGNHGTYNGALYQQTGQVGYGLGFDGTDDFVDCGNDNSLSFGTGDFTLAAWLKTSSGSANIIIKTDDGYDKYYDLFLGAAGVLIFSISDGSLIRVTSTQVITNGEWHWVTVVRTADLLTMYIDGEFEDSSDASSVGDIDNTDNFVIAADPTDAEYYFNGTLDEVAVWDSALTATEISDYYDSQV